MEKTFIFAGFGGQGMLLIGKFVAMACMLDGKHVSWLPSYGPEMRGGTANCSVIVSDDPVASPLVDKADVIVAMNRPSLDKFEAHVKPGGVLVINSSIIDRKAVRDDITVVYCDANGIAESIGNPKGANVAILGATLAKAPVTSVESMMEAIRIELGERKARFLEESSHAPVQIQAAFSDGSQQWFHWDNLPFLVKYKQRERAPLRARSRGWNRNIRVRGEPPLALPGRGSRVWCSACTFARRPPLSGR